MAGDVRYLVANKERHPGPLNYIYPGPLTYRYSLILSIHLMNATVNLVYLKTLMIALALM